MGRTKGSFNSFEETQSTLIVVGEKYLIAFQKLVFVPLSLSNQIIINDLFGVVIFGASLSV